MTWRIIRESAYNLPAEDKLYRILNIYIRIFKKKKREKKIR